MRRWFGSSLIASAKLSRNHAAKWIRGRKQASGVRPTEGAIVSRNCNSMSRTLFVVCVVFGFLSVAGSAYADRPNIVFLFADDQRADTIGAHGNPHIDTPNLDQLAADGFSFRRKLLRRFVQRCSLCRESCHADDRSALDESAGRKAGLQLGRCHDPAVSFDRQRQLRLIYRGSNYRWSNYRRSNCRRSNSRRSKYRRSFCRGAIIAEQLSPSSEQLSQEQLSPEHMSYIL